VEIHRQIRTRQQLTHKCTQKNPLLSTNSAHPCISDILCIISVSKRISVTSTVTRPATIQYYEHHTTRSGSLYNGGKDQTSLIQHRRLVCN